MYHIAVKLPSKSIREFECATWDIRRNLYNHGVILRKAYRDGIIETKNVRCMFVPEHSYSYYDMRYRGLRFDEMFGFSDEEASRLLIFNKTGERYKGSFMDYILEKELG